MNRIIGRVGFGAVLAVLLAFAATLFSAAAPSSAGTIAFTGKVYEVSGPFDTAFSVALGDTVTGSFTFDNSTSFVNQVGQNVFDQSAGSFTFHVVHPGTFDYSHTAAWDNGSIASGPGPGTSALFKAIAGSVASSSSLSLTLLKDGVGWPPLTTLAGLPTTAAGIYALLPGTSIFARGEYGQANLGIIRFTIDVSSVAVATTPIPATLPLFASGLATLGFFARKRRKTARTA